jgi:hypothetical protein
VYPSTFFGLFPAFPRDERGFVAMSFDSRFDARWAEVIGPAIRSISVNDVPLEPHRVDLRAAGDSILTEILDGIARCRIFLADITAIGEVDRRAVRNANVMYEVGLAHAVRQPEEVLLLRSDDRELGFDVANVRVHQYDPDGSPPLARQFVAEKIVQSLHEVDLKKGLAVRRGAESLDFPSWIVLLESHGTGPLHHPATRTMGQALGAVARGQAINKLLDIGALRADFVRPTADLLENPQAPAEQLITYRPSAFGSAIVNHGISEMGFLNPDVRQLLERIFGDASQSTQGI